MLGIETNTIKIHKIEHQTSIVSFFDKSNINSWP